MWKEKKKTNLNKQTTVKSDKQQKWEETSNLILPSVNKDWTTTREKLQKNSGLDLFAVCCTELHYSQCFNIY